MCGRYTLTHPELIPRWFDEISDVRMPPRFNIAPTQDAPVIRISEEGSYELTQLRWGLIPHWAKDPTIGSRLINARSETAHEKPSFRAPFRSRHCLVLADGFFEWETKQAGKFPHFFKRSDSRPFAFAGLWDRYRDKDQTIESFTVLTCDANPLVARIHPRMPVILADSSIDRWLERGSREEEYLDLLRPFPEEDMESFPVSRRVNSPRNDDPRCVQPLNNN